MSLEGTLAQTAGQEVKSGLAGFFKRLGTLAHELTSGFWVREQTWHAKSGIVESTFANGLKVVETPGAKTVSTLPQRWLKQEDGLLRQLAEGSWVKSETWHAKTGVTEQTFANGIKAVTVPGHKPVVTLPKTVVTRL